MLLPYIFIVRIGTLIHPVKMEAGPDDNLLQRLVFNNIADALIQNIVANLLIFVHVLLINYICIKHKLSREITLFSGLFYVLFVSLLPDNMVLSNALIANTFIIIAFKNLLETYKNTQATPQIFNSGFMIGLASLFYSPYFAYLIFGVLSLLMLRSFKLIEKLQFFIGLVIPYFLLFVYRYWNDIPFIELDFIKNMFFKWPVFRTDRLIVFYISVVVLLGAVLVSFINYSTFTAKKSIQTQKKIDIIFILLLFSFVSFAIFSTEQVIHFLTLALPLSLLTGMAASDSKSKIFYEILHLFLLGLIFIGQFRLINF